MWRYLAAAGAVAMAAVAALLLFRGDTPSQASTAPPPPAETAAASREPLPEEAPRASERTREEKRFDRYDKDRNDSMTREEFLAPRRKAYARLDTNGDGKLSFEEWAVRSTTRFAGADKDKSGALTRPEFATTAPKRRPAAPKCACPEKKSAPASAPEESEGAEE